MWLRHYPRRLRRGWVWEKNPLGRTRRRLGRIAARGREAGERTLGLLAGVRSPRGMHPSWAGRCRSVLGCRPRDVPVIGAVVSGDDEGFLFGLFVQQRDIDIRHVVAIQSDRVHTAAIELEEAKIAQLLECCLVRCVLSVIYGIHCFAL